MAKLANVRDFKRIGGKGVCLCYLPGAGDPVVQSHHHPRQQAEHLPAVPASANGLE